MVWSQDSAFKIPSLEPGQCFPNSVFVEGLCSSDILLCWHRLQDKTDSHRIPSRLSSGAPPAWDPWSDSSLCHSQHLSQCMTPRGCSVNLVNGFIYIFLINLFIYFWLHWVFVAEHGLSLVVVSGGYSSLWCAGFSLQWLLLLRSTGSRHVGFSSCGTQAQ